MDHVPLPNDPIKPLPRVPYICRDDHIPYDGSNFLTYPARNGFPMLKQDYSTAFENIEFINPSNTRELESFMQAWAFFGLLYQFFHRHGLYDVRDYLDQAGNQRPAFVHTRKLDRTLHEWHAISRGWDAEQKSYELNILEPCFRLLLNALRALCSSAHSGRDTPVVCSILLLHETLGSLMAFALMESDRNRGLYGTEMPISRVTMQSLQENGWCPTEIAQVRIQYLSTHAQFFLQHLQRPDPYKLDHDGCRLRESCIHLEIDSTTYRSRHVDEACICEMIGPDVYDLERCLQSGSYPLLRLRGDVVEDVAVDVVPADGNIAYVAISHVWADGLGNPLANCLPRCQILRICNLLRELRGRTFLMGEIDAEGQYHNVDRVETRELALWCDTLCVPVADGSLSKIRAIGKLRDVYEKAAYVLVLDCGLESVKFESLTGLEAVVRFTTSSWMRRLWTFQEGGLAPKLLIRFADQTLDFRDIRKGCAIGDDAGLICRRFMQYALAECSQFLLSHTWTTARSLALIETLIHSLSRRRTSHIEDEAICISTILDLDSGAIAAAHPTDAELRMAEMWRQVFESNIGLPQVIIFNRLPRLRLRGFRWAPATFQQSLYNRQTRLEVFTASTSVAGDPDAEANLALKGNLTPYGLQVNLRAWRIRIQRPPFGIPSLTDRTFPRTFLHVQTRRGEWLVITSNNFVFSDGPDSELLLLGDDLGDLLEDRTKDWILLYETDRLVQGMTHARALLTYRMPGKSGGHTLRTVATVLMNREQPGWEQKFAAIHPFAWALRRNWRVFAIGTLTSLISLAQLRVPDPKGLLGYAVKAMMTIREWCIRSFRRHVMKAAEDIALRPEVDAILQQDAIGRALKTPWAKVWLIVKVILCRDMVQVVQSFGSDTEWIID